VSEIRILSLQKLAVVAVVGFLGVPFSLAYTIANYGYCCSYCSYSTKVEKEEEIVATQEHNKPTSKRNPRNSKPGRKKSRKNLPLSTLRDRKQFFEN
jgi:hypothetical protein